MSRPWNKISGRQELCKQKICEYYDQKISCDAPWKFEVNWEVTERILCIHMSNTYLHMFSKYIHIYICFYFWICRRYIHVIYIYIQLQYVYIIAFVNEQHVYEYRHTCPRLFVVHPRDMVPVDYSGLHNTSSITATVTCEHMHIFIYRQICICMFYAVNIVLRKPFESEMCPVTDTFEHSL